MVVTKQCLYTFKCLNMFATFKVLAEKAFEILQNFILMILQNSCFTFRRASFFTLSSCVRLLSHHKSNMLVLGQSPLFLQYLLVMLNCKEESSQLLNHICMTHKTSPFKPSTYMCPYKTMTGKTALTYTLEIIFH